MSRNKEEKEMEMEERTEGRRKGIEEGRARWRRWRRWRRKWRRAKTTSKNAKTNKT